MKTQEVIQIRRKRQQSKGKAEGGRLNGLRLLSFALVCGLIFLIFAACLTYAVISQRIPAIDHFDQRFTASLDATTIYDRDGVHPLVRLTSPSLQAQHLDIAPSDNPVFSAELVRVVVASRQPDFWQDHGNLFGEGIGHLFESRPLTIAEELVLQTYPTQLGDGLQKTVLTRVLASEILRAYGQKNVLTWYLNSAYFGQLSFGADAAARTYLDRSALDLNLAESVLLSAILNAPALNPIDSEGAMRDSYLSEVGKLSTAGFLSDEDAATLRNTNFIIYEPPLLEALIQPNPGLQKALNAAYDLIGQEEIERGGYQIRSTIQYDLQKYLECLTGFPTGTTETDETAEPAVTCPLKASKTIREADLGLIQELLSRNPVSAVVLDMKSGQMLASIDADMDPDLQRAAKKKFTPHEPGTLLTPFIALSAFNHGISPSTMVWDLPEGSFALPAGYANPDGVAHGPVRLRTAITQDLLTPVSELLREMGAATVWNQLAQFGVTGLDTKSPENQIFNGGAVAVDMLATAYTPFANQGNLAGTMTSVFPRPKTLLTVLSPQGAEIPAQTRVNIPLLDQGLAYLMVNVLADEDQSYSYLDRPAGTKIGRVFGKNDAWMIGFTPDMIVAVYVGVSAEDGSAALPQKGAIALWQALMEKALTGQPVNDWSRPANVTQMMVCSPSGKRVTAICPETVSEVFLAGNEPQEADDLYISVPVNQTSRRLATAYTASGDVQDEVYMNLPRDAANWAIDHQIAAIPKEYDPIRESESGLITIYQPSGFAYYEKQAGQPFTIDVKADLQVPEEILFVQVALGDGFYPRQWQELSQAQALENGRWTLASIPSDSLDPGLHDLRVTVVTKNQKFYRADQFFTVQ